MNRTSPENQTPFVPLCRACSGPDPCLGGGTASAASPPRFKGQGTAMAYRQAAQAAPRTEPAAPAARTQNPEGPVFRLVAFAAPSPCASPWSAAARSSAPSSPEPRLRSSTAKHPPTAAASRITIETTKIMCPPFACWNRPGPSSICIVACRPVTEQPDACFGPQTCLGVHVPLRPGARAAQGRCHTSV